MSDPIGVILAAIFGALITGVASESYKRHRDRVGIASAFAGEISAILDMTKRRNYVGSFQGILAQLNSGQDVRMPEFIDDTRDPCPVMKAYLDRMGSLGVVLPEQIARFYQYFFGVRIDVIRLGKGFYDDPSDPLKAAKNKARVLDQDLILWAECVALGSTLVLELQQFARQKWHDSLFQN